MLRKSRTPLVMQCAAAALAVAQLWSQSPAPASRAKAPARQVAVTFDDLPVVSRLYTENADHDRLTRRLLDAVRAHHVPAIGFVNEGKLRRGGAPDPGQVALLRLWTEAGLELGNHTYSHLDLHTVPFEEFARDFARGDSITRRVLTGVGREPRYFRHPFLHTGRDLDTRAKLGDSLTAHGYRVAPVTIDNSDYLFAVAYERALGAGDRRGAGGVAREYLAYMERVFSYYERQSATLLGREIPQVLLLHVNALNADHFDALARMIAARGYAFIPLEQALTDPAYGSADTYAGPAGITWLHRWALTRGLKGAVFAGEPEVPASITAASRPR
jgi:peptidoglycan/xylan/chitin deacetylase (PgdA/CDA1 family)